jgi:hypothetical protein
MHFEILVEDASGKKALDILVPRIIGKQHTFRVHDYKGLGRIPKKITTTKDPNTKLLLDKLPLILRAHGKTYAASPEDFPLIIVCDLDDKCLKSFRKELYDLLDRCDPKPYATFCIAIEEGEAWLLGDMSAIKASFPKAKVAILEAYVNDSICGTWERLADALYSGGAKALKQMGWSIIGDQKSKWAKEITPYMNIEGNKSPSFCYFKEKLQKMTERF